MTGGMWVGFISGVVIIFAGLFLLAPVTSANEKSVHGKVKAKRRGAPCLSARQHIVMGPSSLTATPPPHTRATGGAWKSRACLTPATRTTGDEAANKETGDEAAN